MIASNQIVIVICRKPHCLPKGWSNFGLIAWFGREREGLLVRHKSKVELIKHHHKTIKASIMISLRLWKIIIGKSKMTWYGSWQPLQYWRALPFSKTYPVEWEDGDALADSGWLFVLGKMVRMISRSECLEEENVEANTREKGICLMLQCAIH